MGRISTVFLATLGATYVVSSGIRRLLTGNNDHAVANTRVERSARNHTHAQLHELRERLQPAT